MTSWIDRLRGHARHGESDGGAEPADGAALPAGPGSHLVLIEGPTDPGQQRLFPLAAERTRIGRGADCEVLLLDPAISRLHAEILRDGNRLVYIHRSATNPSHVNGQRVRGEMPITDGDELQLAHRVVLRVRHVVAAPVFVEPPPEPAPEVVKPPVEVPAVLAAKPAPKPEAPAPVAKPPKPLAKPEAPLPVARPAAAIPTPTPTPKPEAPAPVAKERTPEPTPKRADPQPVPKEAPKPSAPRPRIPADRIRIAIVGAGPAGLAAAVQAARSRASHVVLERRLLANTVEMYQKGKWVMDEPPRLSLQAGLEVGFEAGTREDILAEWNRALKASGANLKVGPEYELQKLAGSIGSFTLHCKGGEKFEATHVVLSIGVQGNLRAFGCPGDHLPFVTYQLDDPAAHRGKRVAIVGVGDAGIENALALVEHDNEVFLVNRGSEIDRAKARNRTLAENAIKSGEITYYTNTRVDHFEPGAVVFKTNDGELRLDVDLVIGRLGAIPPRKFLEEMGVEFPSENRAAVPAVSGSYESNVPGLHIIGALAGYPLIKNCMNQGYEAVEHILGHPVAPADEAVLQEKLARLPGIVSEKIDRIRARVPIFAPLTAIQLREFLFDSDVRTVEPNTVVYERNEYSNSFFAILEGSVEAVGPASDLERDAARVTGAIQRERRTLYEAGDFFGEASLLSGRRRSSTVRALSRCTLIEAPRIAMNRLLKTVEEMRRVLDAAFVQRTLGDLVPSTPLREREELARLSELRSYNAGDRLFSEGDAPDGLHLIRRGSVTISQEREGREQVVQYLQAGSYLGELALLAPNRRRSASVTASVFTETVLLPTSAILPFLERHPEVRREFELQETNYAAIEAARETEQPRGTVMFLMQETGAHEATDLLLIDEALCVRCNNCEKACADTHDGVSRLDREAGPTYQTSRGQQLHVPTACQHCEFPKCMDDCPPDALRRHPNGEVYIMDNCIGCGNCVSNCPYDVIQMAAVQEYRPRGVLWDLLFGMSSRKRKPESEPGGSHSEHAVKCDLCRNLPARRSGGARAACVAACPTGALVRVDPRAFVDEILESS